MPELFPQEVKNVKKDNGPDFDFKEFQLGLCFGLIGGVVIMLIINHLLNG